MHAETFPIWTLLPFPALVLAIAILPLMAPHWWERHRNQALVAFACAAPVVAWQWQAGFAHHASHALLGYAAFITTLGALYVSSGGVHVSFDFEATPEVNTAFLLTGAVLASAIGTTGASMLLIRPFLRTNRQRTHREHQVPFFILVVANAGGLLTPLGDPPLLVGYIQGVPFFWTLRLFPAWLLYVMLPVAVFYFLERRRCAAEPASAHARDLLELEPLRISGKRNLLLLAAVVGAALLPQGYREVALITIALASHFGTPREVHAANGFTFAPIIDVAIVFAGLFLCLAPIESALAAAAPKLPVQQSWQLFWASGLLSAVLDNAPTYSAFTALARGLPPLGRELVAGVDPVRLAAVSIGSVVMGATTYIGNGPNLMVKAIAERQGPRTPSFLRYAIFAFVMMVPAHLLTTAALYVLER